MHSPKKLMNRFQQWIEAHPDLPAYIFGPYIIVAILFCLAMLAATSWTHPENFHLLDIDPL